jgi:hypothetical protein
MRSARARLLRRLAVAVLAAAILIALAVHAWWTRPPDAVTVLRAHAPGLARVGREPAPEIAPSAERWTLVARDGETVSGLWRRAAHTAGATSAPDGDPWTIVLLGGLRTGSKAALLVPEALDLHVLALDWPWNGPHKMKPGEFLRRLPEIRRALLRSPGAIALGLEAVASVPEVRADRIAVVGVSLGNAPAIAAARLTEVARAGIFVHGAADLRTVLLHATRAHVQPPALGTLAAAFAARLLQPLEPSLHAAAWEERPVLIISAAHDERLPREAVQALHAAFASAQHRWRDSAHVGANQAEEIAAIATEASEWLASQNQPQTHGRR